MLDNGQSYNNPFNVFMLNVNIDFHICSNLEQLIVVSFWMNKIMHFM